jgi:CBS domain-containing protein
MSNTDIDLIQKSSFEIPLSDLSNLGTVSIGRDASASEALELMRESTTGSLGVVEDRKAVGVVTEKDFLQHGDLGSNNWSEVEISSLMTKDPYTLPDSALVSDAIKLMAKRSFRHVPIIDEEGNFKCMVSIKDLMSFIINFFPKQVGAFGTMTQWNVLTVDNYSEEFSILSESSKSVSGNIFMAHLSRCCDHKPLLLPDDATIGEVVAGLKGRRKGALLLMEYETKIKGIITERDLLFKVYDKEGVNEDSKARDFMTASPHLLLSKHYLAHAINNMFHYKYRNAIVVNEDSYPESIVGLLELFKFMAFHFYEEEISLMKKDASGNVIL